MDNQYLIKIRKMLANIRKYQDAASIVEFDQYTVCPDEGKAQSGDIVTTLKSMSYDLLKSPEFTEAVIKLHEDRDTLDESDRVMSDKLYIEYLRNKNISIEELEDNISIKHTALAKWEEARESNDLGVFLPSLMAVCQSEKKRVMSWEIKDPYIKDVSAYDRMLDEYERGMTMQAYDEIFADCREKLSSILKDIQHSGKNIRTDFLYRSVTKSQQDALSDYIFSLMGIDSKRSIYSEGIYPFSSTLSPDDARISTVYNSNDFASNLFTMLHEGGHTLFELLQPKEDHDHYISDLKSMGMHESVSRFYENIIGRSHAFIKLIYPKLCEIFPQVFFDVSEIELYEAVNCVRSTLIRMDADELTYLLHIIIRYEIEKELIEGDIAPENIKKLWNEKYEQYLGITPDNDNEGVLQDVHWTENLGYFPTYALGNIYAAMYYRTMSEDIDIEKTIENSDFGRINTWLQDHVFKKSNMLTSSEWIKDITGKSIDSNDFVEYLKDKYEDLYGLSDKRTVNIDYEAYVRRSSRIKWLSHLQLDFVKTADEYRQALAENFVNIGKLASQNRDMIENILMPIVDSDDLLTEEQISQMETFCDDLMDVWQHENTDVSIMSVITERLLKDAERKGDDDYIIRAIDYDLVAVIALITQTRRVVTSDNLVDDLRKRGLKAADILLGYLDRKKFAALSEESRELVMINSRYSDGLFLTLKPLTAEERSYRFNMLEQSIKYSQDPFYREMLPNYDWRYHLYRSYQYLSDQNEQNNAAGNDADQLQIIASYAEKLNAMWIEDPDYCQDFDGYNIVVLHVARARYQSGKIGVEEYRNILLKEYEDRRTDLYNIDGLANNIEIPISYLYTIDRENITVRQQNLIENMYRNILSYLFHMPKVGTFYELLDCYAPLLLNFIEFPGGMTFENMMLNSFAACHPPTYIHTIMVANISRTLGLHLLRKDPTLFIGLCGCKTKADVIQSRNKIENYIYHAAICHDCGKLIIIDTVYIYGRRLLDREFETIKQHPALGALMLNMHDSTKEYADVALMHHKWYDGTKGYPMEAEFPEGGLKTVIDIVTCADCMDAATDSVGRSYNKGKTLDDYLEEVKEGAGTRYAAYLYDLLNDKDTREDIDYLLNEGRIEAYRGTWQLLKTV